MFRNNFVLHGVVFCRIIDMILQNTNCPCDRNCFPIRIDLGDGVESISVSALQEKIDNMLSKSPSFATVKTGNVFNRNGTLATEIKSYNQYTVTGSMRGGFIKPDRRFGPQLTAINNAQRKPGLEWIGTPM